MGGSSETLKQWEFVCGRHILVEKILHELDVGIIGEKTTVFF